MATISVKLFLRPSNSKEPKPNEALRLCIKITAERKAKYLNLGYKIPESAFDKQKGIVVGTTQSLKDLRSFTDSELERIRQFIYRYERENSIKPTFEEIENFWLNADTKGVDFFEFALQYIEDNTEVWSKHYTENNRSILKHLKQYAGVDTLGFQQITRTWIIELSKAYANQGKSKNTISTTLRFVKAVFNRAKEMGITDKYPFARVSTKADKSVKRNYLSIDEIQALHEVFIDPKTDEKTELCLRYFLFCCFTGLRLGDVRNLTWKSIEDGAIRIVASKTKTPVLVPLSEAATQYLVKGAALPLGRKLYTKGADVNDLIRDAVKKAGIKKEVSFHVSRHTFASNAIMNNMDLTAVQRLLGHASSSTTEIYVKVVDDYLFKQMDKMPSLKTGTSNNTSGQTRQYRQPPNRKKKSK